MVIFLVIVGVIVLDVLTVAVLMRLLKHPADKWHVDPLTAPKPSTPNSYRAAPSGTDVDADIVSPDFDVSTELLAEVFDRVARADRNVELVGGSTADGHATYVQRSTVFAFPDYISVKILDAGGGRSSLAVFSRSRIGKSDLGVNEKRVDRWLDELAEQLAG